MNVYLDTSTVVAGLLPLHEHHAGAARWLKAAQAGHVEATANLHLAAETWRTLTGNKQDKWLQARGAARITNDNAHDLVLDLFKYIRFVAASSDHYWRAIERCGEKGYRDSVIYDALHLIAAEGSRVDAVVTINTKDFEKLSEPFSPRVVDPLKEGPPGAP